MTMQPTSRTDPMRYAVVIEKAGRNYWRTFRICPAAYRSGTRRRKQSRKSAKLSNFISKACTRTACRSLSRRARRVMSRLGSRPPERWRWSSFAGARAMALIKSFEEKRMDRNSIHDAIDATYTMLRKGRAKISCKSTVMAALCGRCPARRANPYNWTRNPLANSSRSLRTFSTSAELGRHPSPVSAC